MCFFIVVSFSGRVPTIGGAVIVLKRSNSFHGFFFVLTFCEKIWCAGVQYHAGFSLFTARMFLCIVVMSILHPVLFKVIVRRR